MQSEFKLTKKQAEYIKEAHHRWNVSSGAVRSGKSHLQISYTIPARLEERRGKRGLRLILGATRANIERNILQPMRDIYGNSIASEINSKNYAKIFGEKVYCIGADNVRQVAKIRGSEIAYAAIDEATDINMEVFEMLKSRLSLPWSCCDITTNPSSPNHWFKQFLDSADQGVDIYCQNYTIYDNPFLPPEYVHALETEYAGGVWFDRYILGKWTLAEGLIFPNYEKALSDEYVGEPNDYVLSIDYGTSNPFAVILWERYNNVWYGSKELYYSGRDTGIQKTDDEYLQMLEDMIEPIKHLLFKKEVDMWGNYVERVEPITVIIDPSAASFIALLRQSKWFRVREADNSVIDGIRNTSTAIERGIIKISRSCVNWKKEAQSYIWDAKAVEDKPIKENDHLMDSMRYFVQTMRLVRPYDNYNSIFGGRI
jgi:PBSX family phage terminase large subunit